jgi:uncharacterized membrane protein
VADSDAQQRNLHRWVQAMYGLHALALVSVLAGTFLGLALLFALPSVVAVLMNLLRVRSARGTTLHTHFLWQQRSVSYTMLAVVAATLALGPVVLLGVGSTVLLSAYGAIGLWAAWRIGTGWLALRDGHTP